MPSVVTSRQALLRAFSCGHRRSNITAVIGTYYHQFTTEPPRPATNFYDSTVEKWAQQPLEALSLDQLISFGRAAVNDPSKILTSARYVQRELPMRLARRLLDLQLLPFIVVTNPHIRRVYDGYRQSFDALRRFPVVRNHSDNAAFCTLLREQLDQHAPMLDHLAAGLRECKGKQLVGPCLQLDSFFDSMLRSRISRRVLVEQHLNLGDRRLFYIGIISTDLNVRESAQFTGQKARQICTETYGVAPDVVVSGHATMQHIPAHLDYMLFELIKNAARAVVETHHRRGPSSSGLLPSIAVKICDGGTDVTIRVSDHGGGVPPHLLSHIWSYGFSTVGLDEGQLDGWMAHQPQIGGAAGGAGRRTHHTSEMYNDGSSGQGMPHEDAGGAFIPGRIYVPKHQPLWDGAGAPAEPAAVAGPGHSSDYAHQTGRAEQQRMNGYQSPELSGSPPPSNGDVFEADAHGSIAEVGVHGVARLQMAGLGFGLPLSRLYARYFGGELTLKVLPGYGTDAYLTLKRIEASG